MGGKNKRGKTRLDAYYRLAKDQGYRARSAFKLIQLNRKYDFLAKSRVAVDLCAAPGGWCQVCAKFMPVGSKIIGVDLDPIAPIRGVKTFVGDITDDKTKKTIQVWLKKEPVDVVIHDGAPNVGGAWARDLFQQNALVLCSLKLATQLLKPDGWFISKVFRSPDYQKLIWVLKQFFTKVEATKPLASRMESAEIFVVCGGYKAPKTIDPKMFSAQHIFSEVKPEKILNQAGLFVVPKSNVPEGYDEFSTVIHRVATLPDFLNCQDPKSFLRHFQEIRFNQETDKAMLDSKWSKKELVYLCHDLQQVGEADRRRLTRWREQLLRDQSRAKIDADTAAAALVQGAEADPDAEFEMSDEEVEEEDDALKMATELLGMRKAQEKEKKRKQKKIVDRKLKQVRGLINYDPVESSANAPAEEDIMEAGNDPLDEDWEQADSEESDDDGENFEIADDPKTWSLGALSRVDEKKMSLHFDKHYVEPDGKLNMALDGKMNIDVDEQEEINAGGGDEFGERMQLEEGNEVAADVDKHGNYIPAAKPSTLEKWRDPTGWSDDEEPPVEETPAERKKREKAEKNQEALDEAGHQAKWKRHHTNIDQILNETFPKPRDGKEGKKKEAGRKRGRGNGLGGQEDLINLEVSDDDEESRPTKRSRKEEINKGRLRDESSDDDTDVGSLPSEDFSEEEEDGDQRLGQSFEKMTATELTKARRKEVKKKNKEARKEKQLTGAQKGKGKSKGNDSGFQEIPMAMTDPDVRARTLAMATKMLDKKSRKEMIEGGLNRYTYDDDADLPDWFLKDETEHNKVHLPIMSHEIDFQRKRFLEMNARPSKKVMEAMGRKRKKAGRLLRQAVEKGKTDPRAREKAAGLTVRKMMRTTAIKGQPKTRKGKVKFDSTSKGQHKREKQRVKRVTKQKGKKH